MYVFDETRARIQKGEEEEDREAPLFQLLLLLLLLLSINNIFEDVNNDDLSWFE